jgi:hypothetical protein
MFFINGEATNMRALCGARLIECYSITSKICAQILDACATTNDLYINYCENHRLENQNDGNIGVAEMYARQKFDRANLQTAYNEQLSREIDEQFLRMNVC